MLQIFILSGLGIFAMISEIIGIKKYLPYITVFALIVNVASIFLGQSITGDWVNLMYEDSYLVKAFSLVVSIIFLAWFLMFFDRYEKEKNITEYISLFSFATAGGLMMLGYNHYVFLFLGIEILSIPIYVLAGSFKRSLKSNEAAFKYFIIGAFASSLLLLGIAFIYGATGSFNIDATNVIINETIRNAGIIFVLFALAVKIAAVPFHYWTPDVYEGAPTPVTAYMSTLVKAFAAVATFRFVSHVAGESQSTGLYVLAILTMLVGNILGAVQDNPKRTLAYSSIGHAGFMLMAIYVGGEFGLSALLYYILAYSLAGIVAFFVINKVVREDDFYESIGDFGGLYKRNSFLAIAMTIALLSMAGIPPLSGFFAKYFVFTAAYSKSYYTLVVVAIIASLIGVYYYFRFIISMFGKDGDIMNEITLTGLEKLILLLLLLSIIFIGVFPDCIMKLLAN